MATVKIRLAMTAAIAISLYIGLTVAYSNPQSMLQRISHKIDSIKKRLSHDNRQRHKLQHDLATAEIHSSHISQRLSKTKKDLLQQQQLLNNLKANEKKYKATLDNQKALLKEQVVAAYLLSKQPYLKLLLNQQNNHDTNRMLMYYRYINQRRAQAISDIEMTIQQIQKNQQKLQKQYNTLAKLHIGQKQQEQKLTTIKKNRLHLISALNKSIKNRQQRLKLLLVNKNRLEKTINRIIQSKKAYVPETNFNQLRKKLRWPVQGKVLPIFHTKIDQSELRWNGILIKAPQDQPVYAIANGKVVFAKWLSGYGLLLIINHGNGYMTLFGRNHVLYKKVGDIVHHGDLIATVGKTGGYQAPALYFAVRHKGQWINPSLFIRK